MCILASICNISQYIDSIYQSDISTNMVFLFNWVFKLEIDFIFTQKSIPIYKEKSKFFHLLLNQPDLDIFAAGTWEREKDLFDMPRIKNARDLFWGAYFSTTPYLNLI